MTKLSALTVKTSAKEAGQWVDVGPDEAPFRVKTRGFTSAYRDGLSRLRGQAAARMNRGRKPGSQMVAPDGLPPSEEDYCQAKALTQHCLLDVADLTHDDGTPVTVEQFGELLLTDEGRVLLIYCIGAAMSVGENVEDEVRAALGNSPAASVGS